MKKWISAIAVCLLLSGCVGGNESKSESGAADSESAPAESKENAGIQSEDRAKPENGIKSTAASSSRKIIYNASVSVVVDDFEAGFSQVEQETENAGGYMVSTSSTDAAEKGAREGTITVRIPQAKFSSFLKGMEKGRFELESREVTGQDVTEEYVDLESRLKAKAAVEARLLAFMKEADKTADLLAISKDLASVQQEIEQLKGRRNFLQNQTDFSTVHITMSESEAIIPHADGGTWEKTQKQFITSLNSLLAAGSGLFIFLAGNLPLWIVLGVICWGSYVIWRRRRTAREE